MSGAAPGETILIIDDDDLTREGFAVSLRRAGYAVILAADGSEGLDRLRHEARPALILLDMMMPAADGWDFLKELAHEPELLSIPVVITTGLSISCPQWAESLGACGYLRKPIAVEALSEEVRRLV